jgi:hypothetical protein
VQANSKRPRKRDGERRSGDGRPTECSRRLTLAGKLRPAPSTITHIERTLRKAVAKALLDATSDPRHDCPRRATNGSLRGLPALIRSLHVGGEPPPGEISTLPLNNATPWHLTTVCTYSPYASIQSMHYHALHLYTTHNTTAPYIPYYLSTTPSPELQEHALHVLIMVDLGNSHITTSHKIEHR